MARVFTRGGWGIVLTALAVPVVLLAAAAFFGGGKRETEASPPPLAAVRLHFEHLPPSRSGHYELWERSPSGGEQRMGAFRVLEGGSVVSLAGDPVSTFSIPDLPAAGTELLLTLEAGDRLVEKRSERVLLRGFLETTEADLEPALPKITKGQVALLATPTEEDAPATAKVPASAGIWFAKKGAKKGAPVPGLSLPALSGGWVYGGWVVTGADTVLPTGLFPDPKNTDRQGPYSGSSAVWKLPGEDFLHNAPEGVKFPLDLADGRTEVVVSLEPDIGDLEDHPEPFLSLLSARIRYRQGPNEPFALKPVEERAPRGHIVIEPMAPEER